MDINVGQKIYKVRMQKHISQRELAEKANLSQAFISQLESGEKNPTMKTLGKIAEGLSIQLKDFLLYIIGEKDNI